ncbi:MAG: hypothetical protein ABIJ46_02555 [bacterium]
MRLFLMVGIMLTNCGIQGDEDEAIESSSYQGAPIVNGSAVVRCGDGYCDDGEYWELCPRDCPQEPFCGDGACDQGETVSDCPGDCSLFSNECPTRGIRTCDVRGVPAVLTCVHDYERGAQVWVRQFCSDGSYCYGGECVPRRYVCGDRICNGGENRDSCPADCGQSAPAAIRCERTSDALVMHVSGPGPLMADLSGRENRLFVGCNNCGGWTRPYGDSDPRPWAVWNGWNREYVLVFPREASGINLMLRDPSGRETWFDIRSSGGWSITGACRWSADDIVQR